MSKHPPSAGDSLADWADQLQAIARNGLTFATDEYDRQRYERILNISPGGHYRRPSTSLSIEV